MSGLIEVTLILGQLACAKVPALESLCSYKGAHCMQKELLSTVRADIIQPYRRGEKASSVKEQMKVLRPF